MGDHKGANLIYFF